MRCSRKEPRIIVFDTESTKLYADVGFIFCVGWKVLGERKTHLIKIDDYNLFKKDCTDDYEVVKEASEVLTNADAWVGWYSKKHDIPLLNTRLLYHGLPPLPNMPPAVHIDGWRIARYQMKLTSNRLATAAAFLGLEEKTPFHGPTWIRAAAGYRDALKYVYRHCVRDVEITEEVYNRIKILDPQHFNVNIKSHRLDACPRCGTVGMMQSRGKRYAQVGWKYRYQCMRCGGWSTGPPKRDKDMFYRG